MKRFLLAVSLAVVTASALADVNIIVPFAAGGAFDLVGRQYAKFLEKETGQSASVENVTGAGSLVGTKRLQAAAPNTLMITSSSFYANIVKGEFSLDEFTPVSVIASAPLFLVTNKEKNITCATLASKQTKSFIGHAGKDSITSIPAGFVTEKYSTIVDVPYKGISQAAIDLLGNQIQGMFVSGLSSVRSEFDILANTTGARFEGIPTLKECLGVDKTVQTQWLMLASPRSSSEFVAKMNKLAIKFAAAPDSTVYFKKQGMVAQAGSLQATKDSVRAENENWKQLLK